MKELIVTVLPKRIYLRSVYSEEESEKKNVAVV